MRRWLLIGLLTLALEARTVRAQSQNLCVTSADTAASVIAYISEVTTQSPREFVSNSDLPYRPAGGVTLVTDERLCRAAGEAIGHDLSPQSDPGNHRLVLLRVGATHYVVTGPFPDPQIHIILDSAFGKLREVVEAG